MKSSVLSLLLILLLLPLLASCVEKQVYVVYFGHHSGEKTLQEIDDTHHSYLSSVKESKEEAKSSLLYSYKNSINGFAAMLTPDEASKLSEMDEVVSVYRSYPRKYTLHTTRSWEFVGLEEGKQLKHSKEDILLKARYGKDIIVGVMDNGVWPESQSFNYEGMGPIPKSWKGICQSGQGFNSSHCNKKLIGARYYVKGYEKFYGPLNTTLDYLSPRDRDGHGTHTSSIVGGRRVSNASALGGFARGTASGGAPLVRLAIYKACWAIPGESKANGNTCFDEDMLAAIDDAIADGVHVLSISIGAHEPIPYTKDSIAIGSLHATKNNIIVSCSAGNYGPAPKTLSNTSPWIITVAASSLDRVFAAPVVLGNRMTIQGQTVTPYNMKKKMYPLVSAPTVVNPDVPKNYIAGQCLPGSLSPEKTRGKIVMCFRGNGTRVGKGEEVKRAGGVGFILVNSLANGADLSVDAHVLPATAVDYNNAIKILEYINSTNKPLACIFPAKTVIGHTPAPFMATFSSRGPNTITPDILKPDITAPGLNILAAWSEASSPTKLEDDHRIVKYNILSGTSMSCPHVSAAAALLKAIHPKWSSAAIRSALITSAQLMNNVGVPLTDASGNPADPFQYGSGHLRPTKAADPGLVYDASYADYLLFLCSNGVTKLDPSFKCPKVPPTANNLNYPSLAISQLNGTVTVKRTVTNVGGNGKSMYLSIVKPPIGFSVKISPPILFFKNVGQKKSFTITIKAEREKLNMIDNNQYSFGWYAWTDRIHFVRSPLAVSLA
ncbi:subtilisin-like protease SBT5.6 [Cornus florida]|uniref:subtilisin-like protease SBT5.6 n=1 Tax=Cornus florida TaxID=4283 RepID=UPI00289991EB|nr:subtilisin-like protease SBT5.6 [Cornus florida]